MVSYFSSSSPPTPMNALSGHIQRLVFSLLIVLPGFAWAPSVDAQELASCPTPTDGEYLLLVDSQTPEEQGRLEQVLPTGATIMRCQHREQSVIQVGVFEDEELAQSWAEYLTTVEGFQTTVVSPSSAPDQSTPANGASQEQSSILTGFPQPSTSPSSSTSSSYAPAMLEAGYAVLVHYSNQPEIASAVQAILNAPVGLAAYEQQPYLLVAYSTDATVAGQVMQGLSDRQFSAFIVNSRQVVVLTPSVAVTTTP